MYTTTVTHTSPHSQEILCHMPTQGTHTHHAPHNTHTFPGDPLPHAFTYNEACTCAYVKHHILPTHPPICTYPPTGHIHTHIHTIHPHIPTLPTTQAHLPRRYFATCLHIMKGTVYLNQKHRPKYLPIALKALVRCNFGE